MIMATAGIYIVDVTWKLLLFYGYIHAYSLVLRFFQVTWTEVSVQLTYGNILWLVWQILISLYISLFADSKIAVCGKLKWLSSTK